jgi:hypothetical protein
MHAALGPACTGRAILIAVGASQQMHVLERTELKLLAEGDFASTTLPKGYRPPQRRRVLRAASFQPIDLLKRAYGMQSRPCRRRPRSCGCGVLVGGGMPPWSTDEILAVHVRMHQAEGELFREVLIAGARACGLTPTKLREKAALVEAASMLGLPHTDLETQLIALGKTVGAPWGKDQKEAAAAALVALSARTQRPHGGGDA